jgi:putative membrane protein
VSPTTEPGRGAAPAASLPDSTMLAVERTRLAYERTMMAWVRTSTSLISFGFTIYKFFQYEIGKGAPAATERLLSPRGFALVMIGTGLIALLMSTIQHREGMKRLRAESGLATVPISIATVVAALFSVLGILAFLAVLFQE